MHNDNFQVRFFEKIRKKLSPKQNLIRLIGELLFMEKDAIYRRVNGKTPLTMKELQLLSVTFDISIDELLKTE